MNKEDYINVNSVTPIKAFSKMLAKVRLEFDKKHKPFDEQCARLDFHDKLETAEKESARVNGFVEIKNVDITEKDLEKYGDELRFELLEDQEDYVDRVIEGSRTQVVIGHTLSYKCKQRGHGISVFVPMDQYKERMVVPIKVQKKEE